MFDDPKKELRRMEEELFAAEYEEEPESGSESEYEDEDWLQQARELLGEEEEPPIRNHANGYGASPRNMAPDFGRMAYADEELDESRAVFDEAPKKKGAGGLVVLALLEVLGILAILWWWKQWLS